MRDALTAFVEAPLVGDLVLATTAVLLVGLALARLATRTPAAAHAILVGAVVAAALAPATALLGRALGWGVLPAAAPTATTATTGVDPNAAVALPRDVGALLRTALVLWTAASAVLLAQLAWRHRAAARLVRSAPACTDAALQAAAARAASRVGTAVPRLARCAPCRTPAIWCWGARPTVLLPASLGRDRAGYTSDDFAAVLCHELAHARRRDHLSSLAADLLVALLPWQPFAWWIRRDLRRAGEAACDDWAIAAGAEPAAYAATLVRLARARRGAVALPAFAIAPGLRERTLRVLDGRVGAPTAGRSARLGAVSLAAVALVAAPLTHARPPHGLRASSSADPLAATLAERTDVRAVVALPAEIDLGVVAPSAAAPGAIVLINLDDAPRTVRAVKPACGCTTVADVAPTTLEPGAALRIELAMTAPDEPGATKERVVTITVDDQDPLVVRLRVRTFGASG